MLQKLQNSSGIASQEMKKLNTPQSSFVLIFRSFLIGPQKLFLTKAPMYRVFFFNWASPLDWPPPNLLGLAPPKFSKCWNHIHFARHLDVFRSKGGPVWDSDVFLKSVTYRPTLSKFRGGPVKKNTLYLLQLF